ncbi:MULTISPECIES: T9SS type A sorting domain-containing protein [Flavobacterium]|uniref:T9SS type A sorting domain-containing protein n=1 Tax=Flavobacterium TaxID=237 RepID=UPI002113EF05|nr:MULTISPECIES: T9SS type A sorting domain-containing protein [Flavobacterium]UUF13455.1 T9SS type A sorting domain-containing protein [Flavobacterium panici]
MKKIILLFLLLMITTVSSAQFTIWEDDFEDGDVSDWTLLDKDGNSSNWSARKNIQFDESTGGIKDGNFNVLGTYNIDLNSGAPLDIIEQNWAMLPAIDLSYYSGKIELNFTAQMAIFGGSKNILIYGGTSPDPASATLLGTVYMERISQLDPEFKDYVVDISQFVGNQNVYISLLNENSNFVGYEVDKVWITAEALLGVDDFDKNNTIRLKQNPVAENLELEISDQFLNEDFAAKIYSSTGLLVKSNADLKENISVANLPQGIYFLVLSNNTASKKIKFIKK